MSRFSILTALALTACILAGCAGPLPAPTPHPSLAPATQPAVSLDLNGSPIPPMYSELLAVDLPTVIRVANAQNLDIQRAQQQVAASRGRYESNIEAIFPVIAPSIAYNHYQGVGINANGTLTVPVHFGTLIPAISVQWILNPGTVIYDIIASKRRLAAAGQQQQSITLDTTRLAAIQYYDLVLAQAQLQAAQKTVDEAQELLRITQIRIHAGAGLPADEARAQAQLDDFQQNVFVDLDNFYQASVSLTTTLHLDPVVTLVPGPHQITQTTLIRDDLPIDQLLTLALQYRPDLAAARNLYLAAKSDTGAAVWGNLGPEIQGGYSADKIKDWSNLQHEGWKNQQKAGIGASFNLGPSAFGNLKTAKANERLSAIDAQRQLDLVRAAVISAQQHSITNARLIPVAQQQLDAAREALRLTQANLQAGTALVIDVLQAEDAAEDARLRRIAAILHYNQSQINLAAALGLLDAPLLTPTTQP